MKKPILFLIFLFTIFICVSCSQKVNKKDFIKQITDIEKAVEEYQHSIPSVTPKTSISWEITDENSQEIFSYNFCFTNFTIDEQRFHAAIYLKSNFIEDKKNHWYEYFLDTQTFRSRTLDTKTEEKPMEYNAFYKQYAIEEFHSLNLDMSQIKEYTFKESHALAPSAESQIQFEEEYHYVINTPYLVLDITDLTANAFFSYLNGYQMLSLTLSGKTDKGSLITIEWNFKNV